jgi:hypothetical protein
MNAARKPTQRQIDAARSTLIQVAEWADLDGRQRDDLGTTIHVLNQIEDGQITAAPSP